MKTFDEVVVGMDEGQRLAIIRKVVRAHADGEAASEQVLRDVASGDLRIVLVDGVVKFYDQHGRRIPPTGFQSPVVDANWSFRLDQPSPDFMTICARARDLFGTDFIPSSEFEVRVKAVIMEIAENKQTANILKGVHLPILLPKIESGDYGKILEQMFLAAVKKSYEAAFPGRPFNNWRAGELANNVTVVPGTRHDRLVDAMNAGPVVAVYFPQSLQGFGITADREQVNSLPGHFLLSGALDIATAMALYPDVLARDYQTPGLDCAAVQLKSAGYSLIFEAFVSKLDFDHRSLCAHGYCSGGLLVLG